MNRVSCDEIEEFEVSECCQLDKSLFDGYKEQHQMQAVGNG